MGLEAATYISDLVLTNPTPTDPKAQGDDHLRLLKTVLQTTFPNIAGAVTPTHTELNYVDGVTSNIQTQLDAITTLANGKLYIGNGSNVATEVTPTGDVTITNAGVTAIGATKVTKAMLNSDVAASTAQAIAGAATDVFLSPARAADIFTYTGQQSIGASGYQKLPGGLILQWGTGTHQTGTATSGSEAINLPISFPTACIYANAVASQNTATAPTAMNVYDVVCTTSQITAKFRTNNGNSAAYDFYNVWFAIGY